MEKLQCLNRSSLLTALDCELVNCFSRHTNKSVAFTPWKRLLEGAIPSPCLEFLSLFSSKAKYTYKKPTEHKYRKGKTLDIGSPDFVLWGMSRLSQKELDMRDEPEAKLRCLSKCYAVHLGVSDTCPEQFGIKAFHRYFAVMVNLMPCRVGRNEGC
ncbi:hypothetical protein PHYBLDRAFT_140148 [Phycomyces blakesleeanus NRRL 1555(-)]|uniref:Uncharacterized protein n=1 Tax=Phycomyces blakesleeanus (strain ATCC 8743b / DSM 1359 / FGSC 10004 / NBRC 33097 / NRRL 1555) TaxID=763407 RepID=A0A167QRI9_PHYB8|nr:hypothetical protein PHYBLDRAFT_140148 [Phycomyces blakesleeanus NRRL 1555(-)]OAD80137.1 hypothetical protein PHYBLDRAFT_140148 [Phycomyces blakesleeanus NRRL 1555(-)]|eukprot:XP_018298177.1 hypothetical protein PHYBLDRAFT_140148 [Phycomyces blakesleeanus NRRL 1555(-)]